MQTILYVDDDHERMGVTTEHLERAGYRIIAVSNGPDALRVLENESIDLAVVDYYMPGMSGDLVASEMKRLKPEMPVVIFSGTFSMPAMVVALADGFVNSSGGPTPLLKKISELLASREDRLDG